MYGISVWWPIGSEVSHICLDIFVFEADFTCTLVQLKLVLFHLCSSLDCSLLNKKDSTHNQNETNGEPVSIFFLHLPSLISRPPSLMFEFWKIIICYAILKYNKTVFSSSICMRHYVGSI